MLLELRREAQKHRDMATANQREIAKLRRKEKNATEATKRLEKSNLIQRAMLKKRNEEVIKSQNKLRSVLQLLKRAATPNKIFKTITSGITSPRMSTRLPSRQEDRMRKRTLTGPVSDLLQRVSSPARLTIDNPAVDSASVEIRAQFKKQMVDKELATCVLCRRTQKKLEELKQERNKLVGEQRELIAERQRVVQATYEQTNVYDPDTPQYMDERVQAIDLEVSVIDEKMTHLEEIYKRSMGFIDESDPDAQAMDLSWDNALNILRSLDRIELETAVGFFLEDLIQFKVEKEDTTAREEERETVISNLKRMVEVLRTAMINQQQQVQEAQQEEEEQDSLRKKIEQERQAVINEERKLWQQEQKKAKDFLIPRQPSPTRSLAALDTVKKEVFGTIDKGIPRSLSVGTSRLSDIELPPIAAVADLERSGRTSPLRTISRRISPAPEDEPRKDEERRKLLGGSDVFERLANSHTLASQAKVISRTVITEEQPEIVQPQ
ncbi:hypothetical protein EDD86DRAFT_53256 [Gorgonomyces haynaldii]|nr:hypothetical protein EDD86DRAFT_53256 [Gorgonomyces haynaldii]